MGKRQFLSSLSEPEMDSVKDKVKLEKGIVVCAFCDNVFSCVDELKTHTLRSHRPFQGHIKKRKVDDQEIVCSEAGCGKVYKTRNSLYYHYKAIHLKLKHLCVICAHESPTKGTLNRHVKTMHEKQVTSYDCKFCDSSFQTKYILGAHMRKTHPGNPTRPRKKREPLIDPEDPNKPRICDFCGEEFPTTFLLGPHKRKMHPGLSKPNYSRLRMKEGYKNKISIIKDTDINVNVAFRPFIEAGHWEIRNGPQHENLVGEDEKDQSESEDDVCDRVSEPEHSESHGDGDKVEIKEEPIDCTVCEDLFSSVENLKNHILKTHMPVNATSDCSANNRLTKILEDELERDEEGIRDSSISMDTDNKKVKQARFYCEDCPSSYSRERDLRRHVKNVHEDSVEVDMLQEGCKEESYEEKHDVFMDFDMGDSVENVKEELPVEEYFDTAGKDETSFSEHTNSSPDTYVEDRPFKCDECEASYLRNKNLKRHIRQYHVKGVPDYVCDLCGYKTNRKDKFSDHGRNMHNISSSSQESKETVALMCDQCEFTTRRSQSMKEHMLKHKGVRHYCEYCEVSYAQERNLRAHIIQAHDSNKLPCDQCDFTTLRNDGINNHVQCEHLGIKYFCELCASSFSRKGDLKRHVLSLHTEKDPAEDKPRFNCTQCKSSHSRERDLKRHMKQKHDCL